MICSDGGAMHIGAALDKPIVCFFGNSDSTHWHPWAVPYVLLQPASRDVADISVDEAHAASGSCATASLPTSPCVGARTIANDICKFRLRPAGFR
jgi:ADP-heptose:LPS heptosyltransferase